MSGWQSGDSTVNALLLEFLRACEEEAIFDSRKSVDGDEFSRAIENRKVAQKKYWESLDGE